MYIFYDFETSSRELLGQILSYSFILTDAQLTPIEELSGMIKLNKTQLPEIDAILVNQLNLDTLQANGDTEHEAAEKIFKFLQRLIHQHSHCQLVGYNSNQFDLNFLRNLLIRYGYNPYFSGKLTNIDLLHFVQYLAFQSPDRFEWTLTQNDTNRYYSFTLEDTARSLGILQSAQTHDARDDVLLCIQLTYTLQQQFETRLSEFIPFQLPEEPGSPSMGCIYKQQSRHFVPLLDEPEKFTYRYWYLLGSMKKALLLIDLSALDTLLKEETTPSETALLSCVRYMNANKQFLILSHLDSSDPDWSVCSAAIPNISLFSELSKHPPLYFEKSPKDWDIEYQIHELGFERIDHLFHHVQTLLQDPNRYAETLQSLLKAQKNPKDRYLIQLYNRAYLNTHPNVNPSHLNRYLDARYLTRALYRNPDDVPTLTESWERLQALMETPEDHDPSMLGSLYQYYDQFCRQSASLQAMIPEALRQ